MICFCPNCKDCRPDWKCTCMKAAKRIIAHRPALKQECTHEGLKRYCGKEVYCEECKKEISEFLSNCRLDVPHNGPCKPAPSKVEARIIELAYMNLSPLQMEHELRELVRLAREEK